MAKKKKQDESDGSKIVEKEITYICPVRGEVTQKVKVKVYPTSGAAALSTRF
jgi:hypothetical protein